jgi:hypothetical protein
LHKITKCCWVGSVGLFSVALSQTAWAESAAASQSAAAEPSAAAGPVPGSASAPGTAAAGAEQAGASQVNEAAPRAALYQADDAAMPGNYRSLPLSLRANPDEPAPFGYVAKEEVSTKGLIIGGALLGGSYVIGLATAVASDFHNQGGWLAVPLAGPWLSLGLRRNPCANRTPTTTYPYNSCDVSDQHYVPRAMLFLDGVAQLTGAALLVWTLVTPTRKFVRRDVADVHLVPAQFGRGAFGLGAVGRF